MQEAAEGLRGEDALSAMGTAYGVLLSTDPLMLQAQLQTYAAALDDPDVRLAVREGYGDLSRTSSGSASRRRGARFFAGHALQRRRGDGAHEEEPEPWAARLMAGCKDIDPAE